MSIMFNVNNLIGFLPAKVEKRARAQHVTNKVWDGFEDIFWFLKHKITVSNNLFGHHTSSSYARKSLYYITHPSICCLHVGHSGSARADALTSSLYCTSLHVVSSICYYADPRAHFRDYWTENFSFRSMQH